MRETEALLHSFMRDFSDLCVNIGIIHAINKATLSNIVDVKQPLPMLIKTVQQLP